MPTWQLRHSFISHISKVIDSTKFASIFLYLHVKKIILTMNTKNDYTQKRIKKNKLQLPRIWKKTIVSNNSKFIHVFENISCQWYLKTSPSFEFEWFYYFSIYDSLSIASENRWDSSISIANVVSPVDLVWYI